MQPVDRRGFLGLALGVATLPLLGNAAKAAPMAPALAAATVRALETSPYVYVSPLKQDGQESSCHAEVWFAWLDGAAMLITASDRWKAKSVAAGRDRARLWVGDYGRWKQIVGRNEDFKKGPSFEARARLVKDPAVLERLIVLYEKKYPAEIGKWRDKFKSGFASGERVLIAYAPIGA